LAHSGDPPSANPLLSFKNAGGLFSMLLLARISLWDTMPARIRMGLQKYPVTASQARIRYLLGGLPIDSDLPGDANLQTRQQHRFLPGNNERSSSAQPNCRSSTAVNRDESEAYDESSGDR
jgi:hypothetical protein